MDYKLKFESFSGLLRSQLMYFCTGCLLHLGGGVILGLLVCIVVDVLRYGTPLLVDCLCCTAMSFKNVLAH